jgi:hypothetical protein
LKKFHKHIIFCKTKLTGHFRYRDEFQIYPADFEGMPKSSIQEHHPIVLEYVIYDDEIIVPTKEKDELTDLRTLTASTLTKQDKIISLLTLFTNHYFFRFKDLTGYWGLPILKDNPGEEANTWSSKWNMAMFHWPEYPEQFKLENFTELSIPKVDLIEHFSYYYNPNFDSYYGDKVITFPNTIYSGLDSYFAKNDETKKTLNSAISFVYSAMQMKGYEKTMSIIASFTAIETMVNWENIDFKAESCKVCGQLQFKVSQKYRDYLLKYIGKSDNNRKKINAFYKLRSEIIHTGARLKTEDLYANLPKEAKDKEFLNHMEVLQMSKLAVIHWLGLNR